MIKAQASYSRFLPDRSRCGLLTHTVLDAPLGSYMYLFRFGSFSHEPAVMS